jgi:hypothetical protein
MKNVIKIIGRRGQRETKVTLPSVYRESFSRYLAKRKLFLEPPYITDIWNGIQSACTIFQLPVANEVADLIFDDWIDECEAVLS